jgi:P27 family predicted phage terminase small subunit
LTGAARRKWAQIARELAAAGILTRLDHDVLAAFCEIFCLMKQAARDVAKSGPTYLAGNLMKRNPAVAILQQAARDLASLADRLGLSPAARLRLRIEAPREPDELEEFLAEGERFAVGNP